jgi:hypothetical protein
MEKINLEKVCAAYNTARNENVGKKMPREMVINILKSHGISGSLAIKMIRNDTLFTRFQRENYGKGKHIGFIWPSTPIHINILRKWLYPPVETQPETKKNLSFEEECAEYLRKQGYQLKKCVGFDEDSFKKDYPQLYEKYLIYENV